MRTYVVLGGIHGTLTMYVGQNEKTAVEVAEQSRFKASLEVWENETHLSVRLYPGTRTPQA